MLRKIRFGEKSQSIIIQFILFFLIGLGVFIGVGSMFRMQTDIFREDVAMTSLKVTNSYITSSAIVSLGCKNCDVVESKITIKNSTVGYFTQVFLTNSGIRTSTAPPSKEYSSSMHNLNSSLTLTGQAPSVRPINLTFNRNQNKLEISER